MAVVINTNYSATVASNNLATSNSMLQRSLNRLSSGSKIVNPSDDAGGLAVSMKLSAAGESSPLAARPELSRLSVSGWGQTAVRSSQFQISIAVSPSG